MLTRREALLGTAAGAAAAALLAATAAAPALAEVQAGDISALPREKVTLVAPPFVHAHQQAATGGPKVVEFQLMVKEQPMVIDDDGTTMQAMTYNGSIPAPMMVVHEGDYVELTLVNPETNEMPHNVDFHAATDRLLFGAAVQAGRVELADTGTAVSATFKGKTVFLDGTSLASLKPATLDFADGGQVLVGDLATGTLDDWQGSTIDASAATASQQLRGLGGADHLVGGAGDDLLVGNAALTGLEHVSRLGDGVSSILITSNDFAGAWAIRPDGQPMLPLMPGEPRQREFAFRAGANIVMYALTGNYKADQVHVPALLERLGQ